MSNLLKDASILLTPTGYDDGSMNSIKPENGDGDFTFSRNSAATRVNAQGLVENVQIISDELVSNGNFSQIGTEEVSNGNFSQEGSELVTNGDFATDSNWVKGAGTTISGGAANLDGSLSSSFADALRQVSLFTVGKTYKVTYTISNYVSGATIIFGNGATEISANGTYTEYITATITNLGFQNRATPITCSIDNVSVKEVGQGWTLSNGSISDKYNASMTAYQSGIKITPFVKTGNYKVVFDLVITSGSCKFDAGGGNDEIYTTSGTKEILITNPTKFEFNAFNLGWVGTIDNVSVKEVGQDWTIGTGWSVDQANSKAIATSSPSGQSVGQNSVASSLSNGSLAQVSFQVLDITQGSFGIYFSGTLVGSMNSVGTFNGTFIKGTETSFYIRALGTTSGSITNISVKEITDDTDLPRINYEGFSYQDSLGSEEIVNGDFATDSNWNKDDSWTISGGTANYNYISGRNMNSSSAALVVGKTYKLVYTILNYSSGYVINDSAETRPQRNSNGTYTEVFTARYTFFRLRGSVSGEFSIDNVSVKEVLGQEVVPDSGCGSWLLEPQSTNLVTQSNQFDTTWNLQNITISSNQNGVGGSVDAWKLIPSTVNSSHRITNSVSGTQNLAVTLSVYAKADGYNFLRISENGSTGDYATFNLLDGIVENNTSSEAKIKSVGNGWYRCSSSIVATTSHRFDIYVMESATVQEPWSGDGTSGIYIQYAQLESGNLSSYIPTSGAASTRLQDIATNSGNSTLINSTEGVLYAEIAALADDGTNRIISLFEDGNINNRVNMFYTSGSNKMKFVVRINGSNVFDNTITLSNILNYNKVALKYKENDFGIYINGVKEVEQLSGSTYPSNTLDKLNFNQGSGSFPFHGKTKALAVYKEALTDAELQSLTTQ